MQCFCCLLVEKPLKGIILVGREQQHAKKGGMLYGAIYTIEEI